MIEEAIEGYLFVLKKYGDRIPDPDQVLQDYPEELGAAACVDEATNESDPDHKQSQIGLHQIAYQGFGSLVRLCKAKEIEWRVYGADKIGFLYEP